jgi:hypothetical protein
MTFKFDVGQEVNVLSKDRKLSGLRVQIISRDSDEEMRWYYVSGVGIHAHLSFYEDQLSER